VKEPEVEEPPIETLVDLPTEPTMELVSFFTAKRATLSLRSPDVYNSLQIFLQEIRSEEIGIMVCGLVFNGVELPCYAARILFELPSTAAGSPRKPVLS